MEGPTSDDGVTNSTTGEPRNDANNAAGDNSNSGNAITCDPLNNDNAIHQGLQHVRTTIPMEWGIALDHVTADLRITKSEALRQSVAMFLRFHGRGQGIPQPLSPIAGRR